MFYTVATEHLKDHCKDYIESLQQWIGWRIVKRDKEATFSFYARAHTLKLLQIYDISGILPRFSLNSWKLSISFLQSCQSTSIDFSESLDISSLKQAIVIPLCKSFPKNGRCMFHKSLHFRVSSTPSLLIYTILHIDSHNTFSTKSTNHLRKLLDIKSTFFFSLQNLHASTWAFVQVAYKFHTIFLEISHFLRVNTYISRKNYIFPPPLFGTYCKMSYFCESKFW